jgi:hypothetical protein
VSVRSSRRQRDPRSVDFEQQSLKAWVASRVIAGIYGVIARLA